MSCEVLTGSAVVIRAEFRDPTNPTAGYPDGAPCTPLTVAARVLLPDGTDVDLDPPVNTAPGDYEAVSSTLTDPGTYWFRIIGSGNGCSGSSEAYVRVVAARVPAA
jgi:hypothetical protein